nr:hypothetical protein [Tanacetum cinerariifolium]
MIRLRDEAASTSSPPLQLPSADRREDRPEITLPPQKRLGIALGPRYDVGESSSAATARPAGGLRADHGFVATVDREIMRDPKREVGYGITDSWDEIVETLQGAPVSTDTELGGYVREFETRVRQDTDEIYMRLDDEQTERQLLAGRLNMLFRDRRAHAYTRHMMETEARMSREAWVRATDASDLVHGEVMSLRTTVLGESSSATTVRPVGDSRTDYRFNAILDDEIMRDLERDVGYGITNSWDKIVETMQGHQLLMRENCHVLGTCVRRTKRVTRECTYPDIMKCQPLKFKGTQGVVELTQWFEKMETVFHISNCSVENEIKFSTCTLLGSALMWWNSYIMSVGPDVGYAMTWADLKKKMTDKYCLRVEMKKLEFELWNLKSDKIERYVGSLPDMIHRSVVASKPKTMQEEIEMSTKLMDKKIHTFAEHQTETKRKQEISFNRSNRVNAVSAPVNVVGPNSTNSSNSFNTASSFVNAVSLNFRIARKSSFVDPFTYLDNPDMHELEDIIYLDDEEDVGAEADLSNLETNIPVSPILTT